MTRCFLCGSPMSTEAVVCDGKLKAVYCCQDCDCTEEPLPEDYVSPVQTVSSYTWHGQVIPYIDHSSENWPSPA